MSVPVVPGAVPEPLPLPDHILEDHTYPQRPSLTANSETSHASSELSFLQQPFPSLTDQSQSLDSSPALPPSRNTRNLVIDSSAVLPPVRSIRRKPLSSTASASPIAARYSSGEYLTIAKGLPRPEQRFSRSFSTGVGFTQRHHPDPGNPRENTRSSSSACFYGFYLGCRSG
ncbi:hypothetical protein GGS26DRAFT_267631 [Hypomontagnella submonticulosa]|nr:hypothetical protein GGS26DRAFT_267631 [Hypomontagnella submonticulosa]